jgi:hypothetical protein
MSWLFESISKKVDSVVTMGNFHLIILNTGSRYAISTVHLFLVCFCSQWLVLSRSLESLVEGHKWFLNQFVEIPRRSIIVCFLSLSAKAGWNLSQFEISCSWQPPHVFPMERGGGGCSLEDAKEGPGYPSIKSFPNGGKGLKYSWTLP